MAQHYAGEGAPKHFCDDSSRAARAAKTEIESNLATYLKRERPCVSCTSMPF